jgi:hypothetical protein
MIACYILNKNGQPMWVADFATCVRWYGTADRVVAKTKIGGVEVSTVFLAMALSKDQLWETMVFGGPMDSHQWRCGGSREQAEAMHGDVVTLVSEATTRTRTQQHD